MCLQYCSCLYHYTSSQGELLLKPLKFEHIFVAVITFPSFLLCRYFWYQLVAVCVFFKTICESLYRHHFLEHIAQKARVIQELHFLICVKDYSKALWATDPKLCCGFLNPKLWYDWDKLIFSWSIAEILWLEEVMSQTLRGFLHDLKWSASYLINTLHIVNIAPSSYLGV